MALRKISCWLMSLMIVLAALAGQAHSAEAADRTVMELKISADDHHVQLKVIGHRLNDMYAFDLTVQFDSHKLKFKEFSSAINGFSVNPKTAGNTVRLAHTKVGSVDGLSGEAELATLIFERITPAASEIAVTDVKLVDSSLDVMTVIGAKATVPAAVRLTDISGHWAEATILKAVDIGFVAGYPDETFKPQREVTRAEFAVLLIRALELGTGVNNKSSFKDAIPSWAEPYVALAAERRLVSGYPDGTFRPNDKITREEMASIAVRALDIQASASSNSGFADANHIAEWARPYVAASHEAGIMQGRGENQFAPKAFATRAEAVAIMLNILEARDNL